MKHEIYKCDDYEIENNILTIWNAEIVAKVNDIKTFNEIAQAIKHDAIICPNLCNKKINTILFK
jgi:hypothetical protein